MSSLKSVDISAGLPKQIRTEPVDSCGVVAMCRSTLRRYTRLIWRFAVKLSGLRIVPSAQRGNGAHWHRRG
jgi:hypothetical protein